MRLSHASSSTPGTLLDAPLPLPPPASLLVLAALSLRPKLLALLLLLSAAARRATTRRPAGAGRAAGACRGWRVKREGARLCSCSSSRGAARRALRAAGAAPGRCCGAPVAEPALGSCIPAHPHGGHWALARRERAHPGWVAISGLCTGSWGLAASAVMRCGSCLSLATFRRCPDSGQRSGVLQAALALICGPVAAGQHTKMAWKQWNRSCVAQGAAGGLRRLLCAAASAAVACNALIAGHPWSLCRHCSAIAYPCRATTHTEMALECTPRLLAFNWQQARAFFAASA